MHLLGWYGHKNSGDDALLLMTSRMIGQMSTDVELTIQIPREGQLPALPGYVKIRRLPKRLFKGHLFLSRLSAVLGADALVFGGGSTMSDVNKQRMTSLRFKHRVCRAAKLKGMPIVFIALGLGPLVTSKGIAIARAILNMADLVEVRDGASFKLCKELEVSSTVVRGFDPAVLIPKLIAERPIQSEHTDKAVPTIGISLAMTSGTVANSQLHHEVKIDHLVEALRHIAASRTLRIAGIEMCGSDSYANNDGHLCNRLLTKLEDVCEATYIPYTPNPIKMMSRLSMLSAIIAERLHAGIYAYALGIPFAVVPYHSKCTAFAEDVGLPQMCLLDPEIPTEQVKRVLEHQLSDSTTCSPSLPVEEACQLAQSGQSMVIKKLRALLPR